MDFFTSDLHFGHRNILKFCNRPWDTVDDMNNGLIRNWNSVVSGHDRVWVLGDVCMGKFVETIQLIKRLNGYKILVPGNHDRIHPMYQDRRSAKVLEWWNLYKSVFDQVYAVSRTSFREYHLGVAPVVLSHFPYEPDRLDRTEYDAWRPVDDGRWLLHGHVHDEWKVRGRQINVGVDVWDYHPVAADELAQLLFKEMTNDGSG